VGPTRRGKGTKIMAVADGAGLPLAVCTARASPHEVTLVEQTLDACLLEELPPRLIGDKACDSDKLDDQLPQERGIELIAPNRHPLRIPCGELPRLPAPGLFVHSPPIFLRWLVGSWISRRLSKPALRF